MKFIISTILFTTILLGCGEQVSQPKGMIDENLNCPKGSQGYIDRHGGIGQNQWVHSCKKNDGAYHVWRNEVLIVEGAYSNGREVGTWIYRDKNGTVTQTINHDAN